MPDEKQTYYPDQKIRSRICFLEGKLHGKSTLYWPNGALKRECFFQQGLREGPDRMFNDAGILVDEGLYRKAVPIGIHKRYNSKGALIEKIEYLDEDRFNYFCWDDAGHLRVEAVWSGEHYKEKAWDRFEEKWVEKEGILDGGHVRYRK